MLKFLTTILCFLYVIPLYAQVNPQGQDCNSSAFFSFQAEQKYKERWNFVSNVGVSFRSNKESYNPFRDFGAAGIRFEAIYFPKPKFLRLTAGLIYRVTANGEYLDKPDYVQELRGYNRINFVFTHEKNRFEVHNRFDYILFWLPDGTMCEKCFEIRYRLLVRYARTLDAKGIFSLVANNEIAVATQYNTPQGKSNFWTDPLIRDNRTAVYLRYNLPKKLVLDFGFMLQLLFNQNLTIQRECFYFSLGMTWRNILSKTTK